MGSYAELAGQLKLQADQHFSRGEVEEAITGYTAALQLTPENPILWANRAAILTQKQDFEAALQDAEKAVQVDPGYAKAWSRLGTAAHALGKWEKALNAWRNALDALPKEHSTLTPSERKLKADFDVALKKTESAMKPKPKQTLSLPVRKGLIKIPGIRAQEKIAQRIRSGTNLPTQLTSAYPMNDAYESWLKGLERIDSLFNRVKAQSVPSMQMLPANVVSGGLEFLTFAILFDDRVYGLTASQLETLRAQIQAETLMRDAFRDDLTPAALKEALMTRLAVQGWKGGVRTAISITIKSWIMKSFLNSKNGERALAHDTYTRMIDFLEWGGKQWPEAEDISTRESASSWTHADLVALAKDLLQDVANDAETFGLQFRPGPRLAFWHYATGYANSMLAFVTVCEAKALSDSSETTERNLKYRGAAKQYASAAEAFPVDEEKHVYFLWKSLECLFKARATLRETLPLCRKIMRAIPEALKVWEATELGLAFPVWWQKLAEFVDAQENAPSSSFASIVLEG